MAELIGLKRSGAQELADLAALLDSGLITRWGLAIDGGAHVGGWAHALAQRFERVVAFEPAEDTRAMLEANVGALPNVEVRGEALMDRPVRVDMIFPRKSRALTSRRAAVAAKGKVRATTLDEAGLAPDFLKLDLEGAETLALLGARRTLEAHRPFVVIEEFGLGWQYGHSAGAAGRLLLAAGYERVWSAGPNEGYAPCR